MRKLKHSELISRSYYDGGENPYSKSDIENIIGCLSVNFAPTQRERFIEKLVAHTQDFEASYNADQSGKNMNLTKLRGWVLNGQQTLTAALETVNSPFQVRRLLTEYMCRNGYNANHGKEVCAKHLRILLASLRQLEKSLPEQKGDSWPVKQYIRRLKTLYEDVTGKKATRSVSHYGGSKSKEAGGFHTFVGNALLPLGIYKHIPSGIIKSALKEAAMDK